MTYSQTENSTEKRPFFGNKDIRSELSTNYRCGFTFDPVLTGQRIREKRQKLKLTQQQIVEKLDLKGLLSISINTYRKWEQGKVKKLDIEQLAALITFFGIGGHMLYIVLCISGIGCGEQIGDGYAVPDIVGLGQTLCGREQHVGNREAGKSTSLAEM
jgi:DNA-binding XRE family transcriptional regulator